MTDVVRVADAAQALPARREFGWVVVEVANIAKVTSDGGTVAARLDSSLRADVVEDRSEWAIRR
jgi:hypothetical protein